jgi:glutamyl-tRNA reductase
LENRAKTQTPLPTKAVEYSINHDALDHLLRVTCGLESMVVGEDQVVNQVWNSYLEAQKANATGPVLGLLFNRAVNVGHRVRRETAISKGAVSVGSAAVELAECLLGSLNQKKILIMGAGETGTLVAKAMARRCLNPVFIANRTYERAQRLAEELGGKAVMFDKLGQVIVNADVVFCCTSAPHYLLTKDLVSWLTAARQNKSDLLIIDLSNPRNVEQTVAQLPHVKLYNIDDLNLIAQHNKEERQKSVIQAYHIVDEELATLERAVKADSVRETISELLSEVEVERQRELAKALKMMGKLDERQKKIVSDLTCILLKQTYLPFVENFRRAAENNDTQLVEATIRLLEKQSPALFSKTT